MSVKNLQEFYQVVLTDPALQDRIKMANDAESFVQLAVALGQEKGYSFSFEDVETALKHFNSNNAATEGELSDEELIGVAGGGNFWSVVFNPESWKNTDAFKQSFSQLISPTDNFNWYI